MPIANATTYLMGNAVASPTRLTYRVYQPNPPWPPCRWDLLRAEP